MTDNHNLAESWGEPIHTHARAGASADGVLANATAEDREAGLPIPVALTANVWTEVNDLPGRHVSAGQGPEGRLWDPLFVAARAARRPENRDESGFIYSLVMPVGLGTDYRARCHAGPGDEGAPVVTITRHDDHREEYRCA